MRKKFCSRQGKRAARIFHADKCDGIGQPFGLLLGHDGHRAGISGLPDEMRTVGLGARDGDEQKPWLDLAAVGVVAVDGDKQTRWLDRAAVGGDAGNIDRAVARVGRRLRQKVAQLHRGSFALTSSIWSALGRSKRGGTSSNGATRSIT